ncbi:MAG: stage III sporulation protein AB [Clostridia bacterium]|nr:stage III sporulation protein AB [Clostridia bacterium]
MLKITGIILIVVSCSAIGISAGRHYKQRTDGIRSFIDAFRLAKAEIVFKNLPLADVYKELESQCSGMAKDFFKKIRQKAQNPKSFTEDLGDMLGSDLKEPERAEITNIMSVMGRYDSTNQAELIDKSILRLEEYYKQAQEELAKNGKLSSAFGVTCGIVIAVLLL